MAKFEDDRHISLKKNHNSLADFPTVKKQKCSSEPRNYSRIENSSSKGGERKAGATERKRKCTRDKRIVNKRRERGGIKSYITHKAAQEISILGLGQPPLRANNNRGIDSSESVAPGEKEAGVGEIGKIAGLSCPSLRRCPPSLR